MAKNNNLKDFVTGVAGAIREKKGTTELINPQDFESEIRTIQTGTDTSDATAVAVDIRLGKTAYGADGKMTGTIADYDGTSEPASGKSLFAQLVDRSVKSVSKEDLKGITTISYYTFYNCSNLTSITIPNSVASIENYAFQNCTGLTSVTIPNSVASIGNYAFYGCSKLTSITIPNSVTSIGDFAFANCYILTGVYITDLAKWCGVSFGNENANPLSNAGNLYLNGTLITELIIPNSVTSIGDYVFSGCKSLTSVTIPNSVTSIGDYVFSGCESLISVTIPDSVTSIGDYVFSGCTSLTSVTIPEGVTSINSYTFYNCSSLTSITIPNGVTSIGTWAFQYCRSLTSITIPGSVTRIEIVAFSYCSTNTELGGTYTILATTPPTIQSSTFSNAKINKIIVPKGTLTAYKSATNWSALANKIEEATE